MPRIEAGNSERVIRVGAGKAGLEGSLAIPAGATGIVLFAHGSGSSRLSPRNRLVAEGLRHAGLATLLLDLLTPDEGAMEFDDGRLRFDIGLLADRLVAATDWLTQQAETRGLRIGYFGASTGAAAALAAAAERPDLVAAIVSRGGRPELAGGALPRVQAPTLLLVGGDDLRVIDRNREALAQLQCERRLEIIPGASHLFEEPGALERVSRLARAWLVRYLAPLPRDR